MNQNKLSCVNKLGHVINYQALQPFLNTVEPAFAEHASEISFGGTLSKIPNEPPKTFASYKSNERIYSLTLAEGFNPFVTSSRLRLMADVPAIPKPGILESQIRLQFGEEIMELGISFIFENDCETVILKPKWH